MSAGHLRQYEFPKGVSGDPRGRPRREHFESVVSRILDEPDPATSKPKREALARRLIALILDADDRKLASERFGRFAILVTPAHFTDI